jgi:chromosome segregation ATPase
MQAHLDSLQDQIEHLRAELEVRNDDLRRKDTIIAQMNQTLAAMAQHIPELEPARETPSKPREQSESARESAKRGDVPPPADTPDEEGTDLPWWRRIFR